MYFIPRYNKAYALLVQIPPLYRYLLTGVGAALLVGGVLCGIYIPLEAQIAQYQQNIAQMEQQRASCVQLKKSCAQKEQAIDELRTSLAAYTDKQSMHTLQLLQYAQQAGLLLGGYTTGARQDKQWYILDTARMTFSGDLAHIVQFFDTLIQAGTMATCQKLSLSRTQDNRFALACDFCFAVVKKDPST